MTAIQPPMIPAYFNLQQNIFAELSSGVFSSFFLSWEDALWHLLQLNKVKDSSVVLVPEFFCGDVILNMQAHGLRESFYKVDRYLQPNKRDFIDKLKKYQPAVIVIFHSVGMKNKLFTYTHEWLKFLPKNSILIEDCVHRVVNPSKIKLVSENHYVLDSLRKVVPIQGCWVYSAKKIPKVAMKTSWQTAWYRFQVLVWWICMQVCLVLAYYLKHKKMQTLCNVWAEFFMMLGYDVIGDHKLSGVGIPGMDWLSSKISLEKIYQEKQNQAKIYKKLLKNCMSKFFYEIPVQTKDYSQLRGFPLGVHKKNAGAVLKYLRSEGLLVRLELNDSPWSTKQKVIYLPMGLHVSTEDIKWVAKIICSVPNLDTQLEM